MARRHPRPPSCDPVQGLGMNLCLICGKNEAQYKCPRCQLDYCSLACYQSMTHVSCTESFFRSQVMEEAKAGQSPNLSPEEKMKLAEMFKRMSQFDIEWPSEADESEPVDPLAKLADIDLDSLSVEEIEQLMGPDLLKRFQESFGKDAGYMDQIVEKAIRWTPWWDSKVEAASKDCSSDLLLDIHDPPPLPADLPPISSLTKTRPVDFFWNNLAEIMFGYSYLNNLYLGSFDGTEEEVIDGLRTISKVLVEHGRLHQAAILALNTALDTVRRTPSLCNPSPFLAKAVKDLIALYRNPEHLLRALNHLYSMALGLASKSQTNFLISKKLYFYMVWYHSELVDSYSLVEGILKSMILIFGGLHDRLSLSMD